MNWVDSTDLKQWADRRDCQGILPLLVRKLIRATSCSIQKIKFPSGDNIATAGWDGILEVTEEEEHLPSGISVWEFGSNKNIKGKADEDYNKRTKDPIGINPAECTFIFVTPRLWTKSQDWIEEKKLEGVWKDIKVIDAETLEEWLEQVPTVANWLAVNHLGTYPEGVQPSEEFWEEWTAGPRLKLDYEILLGGRQTAKEVFLSRISLPSVIEIQGTSREESLAFAMASCFGTEYEEDFFSRSLIVDSVDVFRRLSSTKKLLILIPRFEDVGVFHRAIAKGHTIIVPLGADSSINGSDIITLPSPDRDQFIKALVKSGLSRDEAEKNSRESARNLSILRRQLQFEKGRPEWAKQERVRELIPALLVGRWNEESENDKAIIFRISGVEYAEFSNKLNLWRYTPDAPMVKIGNLWRLTSPLDAWTNGARYLTRDDLFALQETAIQVFTEKDPALELVPEKRYMASIYGKRRTYSHWLSEGVAQSLILVSKFGVQLHLDLPQSPQDWVDNIVSTVLASQDPVLWKSFEHLLPLIAEASPNAFLTSIEKHLNHDQSPIPALFNEDPAILTNKSYHTGLLWALEKIAWLPDFLARASLVLAKLAALDPGGSLVNRPINSLIEIFKPWHYQTFASLSERMEVLMLISKSVPSIGWKLLISLLPKDHDSAHSTAKLRWKADGYKLDKPSYKEIWDTNSRIIDLLLLLFDYDESKAASLISKCDNLNSDDRNKIFSYIKENIDRKDHSRNEIWHETRRNLSHHRSYPAAEWALPEEDLKPYQELYQITEPKNPIQRVLWLFDNDHWPDFVEGYDHKKVSTQQQEALINQRQVDGITDVIRTEGLATLISHIVSIKQPYVLGSVLAQIIKSPDDIRIICDTLCDPEGNDRFAQAFLYRWTRQVGLDSFIELFGDLRQKYNSDILVRILLSIEPSEQLWKFIDSIGEEIKRGYWSKIHVYFYHLSESEKMIGINHLTEVERYFTVLNVCYDFLEEIPIDTVLKSLENAASRKSSESFNLRSHHFERIFEYLDNQNISPDILINLEWQYLPILSSYGSNRKPKKLHDALTQDPEFFIETIKIVYKPEGDSVQEDEIDSDRELIKARSIHGYELLGSWKRVPGLSDDGELDGKFLIDWVSKVRELAKSVGRIEVVEGVIGRMLANYPEKDRNWPPVKICEIIENSDSDRLHAEFAVTLTNKRGSSVRGPFDGGDIERGHANYFNELANKHRNTYPKLSAVFDKLKNKFERMAKSMDDEAERDKLDY